jgi:hypothetical protein
MKKIPKVVLLDSYDVEKTTLINNIILKNVKLEKPDHNTIGPNFQVF